MTTLSIIFTAVCAFCSGLIVGCTYLSKSIIGRLQDAKFRIPSLDKEKLYVANKVVTERWVDGLAEFEVVDLKEYKQ